MGGTLPPVLGDGEAGGRRTRLPGPAASVPGVLLACHHTGFTASRAAHRHVCRAAAQGLLCAPGGQLPVLAPVSLCLPHPRAPWTSLSVTWGRRGGQGPWLADLWVPVSEQLGGLRVQGGQGCPPCPAGFLRDGFVCVWLPRLLDCYLCRSWGGALSVSGPFSHL